jgi:hypothetical protein
MIHIDLVATEVTRRTSDLSELWGHEEDLIGDLVGPHGTFYWPAIVNFVVGCTVFGKICLEKVT